MSQAPTNPILATIDTSQRPAYAPPPRRVYPPRTVKQITATQDISALLAGSPPNMQYVVAAGVSVTVKGSPLVSAANVSLIGSGGSRLIDLDNGAGIVVRGEGFDCQNFLLLGQPTETFFRAQAAWGHIRNVWNANTIGYLATLDGPNEPNVAPGGGADWLIEDCGEHVKMNADFVYCNGADRATIKNATVIGLIGEHGLRFDSDVKGHPSTDFSVIGGTYIGNSSMGKECIAVRQGWGTITGPTIFGPIRIGQETGSVLQARAAITAVNFHPDSNGQNYIQLKAGTAWVDANNFLLPPSQRAIGYQQGQGILASADRNTMISQPHGGAMKRLVVCTEHTSAGDVYHENDGTNTRHA